MNIKKLLCLFITPLFLFQICPAFAYIDHDIAVVRVMDKAAGKTQILPINVEQPIQYDGLKIVVRSCKQSDPFDALNFYAFVEIYTKSDERIFSGWMNHNEPGQNPLQDDAYDVWLEKCE